MSRAIVMPLRNPEDPGFSYSVSRAGSAAQPTMMIAAWDGETGTLIGRCEIAATGPSPVVTPGDLLARFGGRYRLAAVRVDVATERLATVTRRIARACARRREAGRRWRRSGPE
ncbi:hypothetical protein [Rhodoplanes azumiensis]|uniref:Uncharacterized protein n=1 Tax=Rhodoplanes azumiensis TaxID=1897628 RepID=A0ABW5AHM9_9BRAD